MSRKPRWIERDIIKGVVEVEFSSWKFFSDYINQELLDYTTYFYRGQGDSNWKLEPSLDRVVKSPTSIARKRHLDLFKLETRGRRGPNPALLKEENDWWALGQHQGLKTPLLDWTESPFVALFFAVHNALRQTAKSYTVYALSEGSVQSKNLFIRGNADVKKINNRVPTVKIVRPYSDENSRLVSQRGMFTRGPNNMDLETWVSKFDPDETVMELIKLIIPNNETSQCLRYLNRMNINHSTLFPDLTGASDYCNTKLSIKKY